MKIFALIFLLSDPVFALDTYPLKLGIGAESCHPNQDGLTECFGFSPRSQPIKIQLTEAADGGVFFGYFNQSGTFEKIGFEAAITVIHYDLVGYDDNLKITLKTWFLENPEIKTEATFEIFADKPENLNRINFIAKPIGSEQDYSTVILGLDHI